MRSRDKWLEVRGQKKWTHYCRPESRRRRAEFFGHFLQHRQTTLPAWPRVRLEICERAGVAVERAEAEWPLARTRHAPL